MKIVGPFENAGTIVAATITQFDNAFNNSGTISAQTLDCDLQTNSGTISVTNLYLENGLATNSGDITVTGGTLSISGSMTLAQLTSFLGTINVTNSQDFLTGTLDLGGGTVNVSALSTYGLGNESLVDGTLVVGTGETLSDPSGNISAGITNDGLYDLNNGGVTGDISGTGTIALSGFDEGVGGAVSAGQTVLWHADGGTTQQTLNLSTILATTGFLGTLTGLAAGDTLAFSGEFNAGAGQITAANIVGDSIQVTFSAGATISLATASALTGSFTLPNLASIEYSTSPAAHDWTVPSTADVPTWRDEAGLGGAVSTHNLADIFLIMAHHGLTTYG